MLKNFKIRHKLALMGLLMSLPALILLVFFVLEKNKSINQTEEQRMGNAYLRPLRKVLETMPQYQRGGLADTALRIDEAFKELDAVTAQNGEKLGTIDKVKTLRAKWQNYRTNWANSDPGKRLEMYRGVMQETLDLFSTVGYTSNLVLTPGVDGFFMADSLLVRLPDQVRQIAEITQLTDKVVTNKAISADERQQLALLVTSFEQSTNRLNNDFKQANSSGNFTSLKAFESSFKKNQETLEIYIGMVREKILKIDDANIQYISTQHVNSISTNAMTASSNMWRDISDADEALLVSRISGSRIEMYLALGLVLLVGAFAFVVAWLTARGIVNSLDEVVDISDKLSQGEIVSVVAGHGNDEFTQLMRSMERMTSYLQDMAAISDDIADGNLSVQVQPKSEKDRFGNAFQNMLERTLKLVQSQDERDALQNSIMKLLGEVADVASGDLTAQAEVTPDMTGAIADAFNYMIDELRRIISQVQQTTNTVDSSASVVQTVTEKLAERSEFQSAQLAKVSEAIEQMVSSVQQVADSVSLTVSVADESLENARKGTNAVQNNISAMNRLREQATETAARIRKLGERSAEITGIVKLIDDVARRANILALNATIQATAAGEQGQGFIVVAREVERLAERSLDATRQITALTQAIQGETSEAVASIEDTMREVAVGAKLAGEVAGAIGEMEQVSNRLSLLSQVVLTASKEQAEGSEQINRAMREISSIAENTAEGVRESAVTVNNLALSARELRTSLASFKLPEDVVPADGSNTFTPSAPSLN